MQIQRRDALRLVARRRARSARRTSGRVLASALGFGVAYYFDAANGRARRRRLRTQLGAAVRRVDGRLAPDAILEDARPVLFPRLRTLPKHPTILREPQSETG